jgi:hypothetical protein
MLKNNSSKAQVLREIERLEIEIAICDYDILCSRFFPQAVRNDKVLEDKIISYQNDIKYYKNKFAHLL